MKPRVSSTIPHHPEHLIHPSLAPTGFFCFWSHSFPALHFVFFNFLFRRSQFESHDGSSDSTLSPYTDSTTSSSHMPMSSPNYSTTSSYSPSQNPSYLPQTVAAQPHHYYNPPGPYRHYDNAASSIRAPGTLAGTLSPELTPPTNVSMHERPTPVAAASNAPNTKTSPQLSPVFKSEAAKQIIKEMTEKRVEGPRRRQIPREKRRHYTVSSSKPVLDLEDTFSKMVLFVSFNFHFYHFPSSVRVLHVSLVHPLTYTSRNIIYTHLVSSSHYLYRATLALSWQLWQPWE